MHDHPRWPRIAVRPLGFPAASDLEETNTELLWFTESGFLGLLRVILFHQCLEWWWHNHA